jgi:hypothetical protein
MDTKVDTYDACERFHERKRFCKSATYVNGQKESSKFQVSSFK